MEWQPIETAPKDEVLELGRWEAMAGRRAWFYVISEAKVTKMLGPFKWVSKTYEGRRYTHWRYPPPPP